MYAYTADHVYFNEELQVEQVVATLVILLTAFIVTYYKINNQQSDNQSQNKEE